MYTIPNQDYPSTIKATFNLPLKRVKLQFLHLFTLPPKNFCNTCGDHGPACRRPWQGQMATSQRIRLSQSRGVALAIIRSGFGHRYEWPQPQQSRQLSMLQSERIELLHEEVLVRRVRRSFFLKPLCFFLHTLFYLEDFCWLIVTLHTQSTSSNEISVMKHYELPIFHLMNKDLRWLQNIKNSMVAILCA